MKAQSGTLLNLLDSSGWLDFFAGGPNADAFQKVLLEPEKLLVPTIVLYEVYKKLLQETGREKALRAIAAMRQGRIMEISEALALSAAELSFERRIAMADSIILAIALAENAIIWTQDADFQGMPNVQYLKKR